MGGRWHGGLRGGGVAFREQLEQFAPLICINAVQGADAGLKTFAPRGICHEDRVMIEDQVQVGDVRLDRGGMLRDFHIRDVGTGQ